MKFTPGLLTGKARAIVWDEFAMESRRPAFLLPTVDRTNLAQATADILRESLRSGRWDKVLPGEHELKQHLQVSRNTVRGALNILALEGLVRIQKGHRTEIIAHGSGRPDSKARIVRLVSSYSAWEYTPFMSVWSQEIRRMFSQKGIAFQAHQLAKCYTSRPEPFLKKLVAETKCDLWVLHVSTAPMQRWFEEKGLPVLLAGTPHEGVHLPFVDVDSAAAARHALGILLKGGHEKIVYLCPDHCFAGDLNGYRAACEMIRRHNAGIAKIEYSDEFGDLERKLAPTLAASNRPTAIVTSSSMVLCGVFSILGKLGLRVPSDVSVVSLQSGSFVRHISPTLAHYSTDPQQYARRLMRCALKRLNGERLVCPENWLLPTYLPGESVRALGGG